MRTLKMLFMAVFALWASTAAAGSHGGSPDSPADTYELYLDPLTEAFPGQDDLLIPLRLNVSEPTVGINVTLVFDPSLIDPIIVAPNFFFQSFITDFPEPGTLTINALTDLPPPPEVPPIEGDTIFAWILCQIIAQDPGYDVMTQMTFFEDPYTPYPDNNLLLENGSWITPPYLILTSGDILIFSPIYGDININGYAYEIGDAVTFMNYFMGLTEFNARQYANSDCNRDNIQATIADLVYLLLVINGDTILVEPPPIFPGMEGIAESDNFLSDHPKIIDSMARCDVFVKGAVPLGGAYFEIEYDPLEIEPAAVMLDSVAAPMEISCVASEGKLKVAIYNWNPSFSRFTDGRLFTMIYNDRGVNGKAGVSVIKADFSDNRGVSAEFEYSVECSREFQAEAPDGGDFSISSYPNPFNNAATIRYNISSGGNYELSVFDILGRRVRTLVEGYLPAGENVIVWDGTNNARESVASGIYFVNLHGETIEASAKVFLMK